MFLLDINVLIALAWDDHTQHEQAQKWFASLGGRVFSTCHVTQSSFLRVSLSLNHSPPITDAIAVLKAFTSLPGHSFWNDGPVQVDSPLWASVTHRNHVTDLNLFLIARRHNGALVTFDKGIANRLPEDERKWVELIQAEPDE